MRGRSLAIRLGVSTHVQREAAVPDDIEALCAYAGVDQKGYKSFARNLETPVGHDAATRVPRVPVSSGVEPAAVSRAEQTPGGWRLLQSIFQDRARTSSANDEHLANGRMLPAGSLTFIPAAGGVGVTTVVATLARIFSLRRRRVLLVDGAAPSMLPLYFGGTFESPGRWSFLTSRDSEEGMVSVLACGAEDAGHTWRDMREYGAGARHVLLDIWNRVDSQAQEELRAESTCLVVLTPDVHSAVKLRTIEKTLGAGTSAAPPIYLLNRFDSSLSLHQEFHRFFANQLAERLLTRDHSTKRRSRLRVGRRSDCRGLRSGLRRRRRFLPSGGLASVARGIRSQDERGGRLKFPEMKEKHLAEHQISSQEEDDFEFGDASRKKAARHGLAALGTICLVALLGLLATVPLDWKAQAVLGGILFAVALIVSRRSRGRQGLVILMVVSLFCTTRYFWWRVSETSRYLTFNGSQTSPVDMIFIFLLLGAEAYGVVILVLGYFQGARPLRRKPVMLPDDIALWPAVDVFIPTYNEPLDVVRTTVLAALNIDWPRDRIKVYVLDDGKRSEVHTLAEECGAGYFARLDNAGAKAGNLNYGLARTTGEYVAIFDSDHIPTRSFLQMTVGGFLKNDRLALVQTPLHFYSADPFERNMKFFRKVPNENELFYGILQDGNDFWNAAFFCGSCAVLRRTALEEVGGVATDTVTEDSHTAVRLQRLGWHTSYINIPLAAGLATANLADHIQQRIRWARGMIQILRIDNPLFGRGLNWKQRLCYFNAVIHFLHATPRLIFLTAPLVYLLLGRSNLYGYAWAVLAYVFPHLFLATLTSSRIHGRYRHSFWNEVFETVLAPYILLPTMLALINPRWGKFNVTPKRNVVKKAYFDLRIASPFLILLALNFAGLTVAIRQLLYGVDDPGTVTVNLLWTMLNILILGATLAVPWEIHQWRANVRIAMQLPIRLILPTGGEVEGVSLDISTAGAAVQLDRPCGLNPGNRANIVLRTPDSTCVLPAHVRRTSGLRLGLKFVLTDMHQHEALIRLLFGRADSWIRWSAGPAGRKHAAQLRPPHADRHARHCNDPQGAVLGAGSRHRRARSRQAANQVPPSILLILLAALVLPCQRVQAAEPFDETRDLAALGQQKPVTFRGGEGSLNLTFGVPTTKLVQNAALNLSYRSSGGFDANASRLMISLNGFQLATIPVQRKDGDPDTAQQIQVALPPDLVVPDNRLAIQLSGHCASGCKEAVEWVRVESATNIRLSGTMVPLVNTLRILPAPFFDASVHRAIRLPMIFAEDPDDQTLQAAGVVASWFGVMADDRGAKFAVRTGSLQKGDAVLLTKRNSAIASQLDLAETTGPAIANSR